MRILVINDAMIAARIISEFAALGIGLGERDEAPVPECHLYEPREYPASSKYVREKDWIHDKGKNQYKQKRRGRR